MLVVVPKVLNQFNKLNIRRIALNNVSNTISINTFNYCQKSLYSSNIYLKDTNKHSIASTSSSHKYLMSILEEENTEQNDTNISFDDDVKSMLSITNASSKEILNQKIHTVINKFRIHATDKGSSGVQIAILTEKILNVARHLTVHKKDKSTMRGYRAMINQRRTLMKYMRKKEFDKFVDIIKELGLEREAKRLDREIKPWEFEKDLNSVRVRRR